MESWNVEGGPARAIVRRSSSAVYFQSAGKKKQVNVPFSVSRAVSWASVCTVATGRGGDSTARNINSMLWPLCSFHLTDMRVSIECKFECGIALNFVRESFAHQVVKPTRPTAQIPDLPFSLNAFESPADQKYNSALLETYSLTLLPPLVWPGELDVRAKVP